MDANHAEDRLRVALEPNVDPTELREIEAALYHYNMMVVGDHNYKPVHAILRDDKNVVKGGALGGIWGGWLHLQFLWVAEEMRGQGYGSQLLATVEAEATAAKCQGIYLETFDFQAYPFYRRHGYETLGQVENYPPGHTHYFMAKRLTESPPP